MGFRTSNGGLTRLPRLSFCAGLAFLAVAARVALVDHAFLLGWQLPSHDMAQGLAFFTTSMHSVRLTGDLAWWNPASITGYAQYFQAQLGPLAPTWGHVVFIAWAHGVAILASLGIAMPEYLQYVAINYLVLPFLAFTAFAYFSSLILASRAAVALAVLVYALSGIGLWNSAWFYFQEPLSLFFLLATFLAVLRRPGAGTLLAFLAAALVQLASLNYWTLHNSFFVLILTVTYVATHPRRLARLLRWVGRAARMNPGRAVAIAAAFLAVAGAWSAVIHATVADQSANNVRPTYTAEQAVARIPGVVALTTALFEPSLDRAVRELRPESAMHAARYVGVALLPLLALGLLAGPRRRVLWLLACAGLVAAFCVGSALAVAAWTAVPYADRLQHVFYFYTHHWQVLVALVAAVGLDAFVRPRISRVRSAAPAVLGTALAAGIVALGVATAACAALRGPLIVCVASGALLSAALVDRPLARRAAAAFVVLVTLADLAAYFREASLADMAFTAGRPWDGVRPTENARARLFAPWDGLDATQGFGGGLHERMPLRTEFWPDNVWMLPPMIHWRQAPALARHARDAPPFAFFDGAVAAGRATTGDPRSEGPDTLERELRIADPALASGRSTPVVDGFAYRWRFLRYNEFEFEAMAPADGWLMVRQLHDPAWRVRVDGTEVLAVKANDVASAVRLPGGNHVLRWEYRPRARRIYWFAAALLEGVVATFLAVAWRSRARPSRTTHGPIVATGGVKTNS